MPKPVNPPLFDTKSNVSSRMVSTSITLRDIAALFALATLDGELSPELTAEVCYEYADAFLTERQKD